MQIAVVTSEIGTHSGGLSYSCLNYAEFLSDLGYKVSIISSINNNIDFVNSSKFNIIGSEITICDGGYIKTLKEHLFFRGHIKNIINKIGKTEFEFIIAFGAGLNGLFASELARLTGTKLIVLLRGSEINLSISDTVLYQYNYFCLKQATSIISLSTELLEIAKTIYFDASKIYKVIPNWTECSDTVKIPGLKKNKFILGCGSKNLNEKKGISNLISMLNVLNRKSDKQFHFEFAGNIDSDLLCNYQNLCRKLGVTDKVSFIEDLSREEFKKRLSTWDFYIQGSFCEGFSNSIGDCLKLGIPVIVSKSGFIAESLQEIANEIIFDDFVPESMSDKILKLIQNPELESIYKKAIDTISSVSNANLVRNQWISLFENTSKGNKNSQISFENIQCLVFHDISDLINSRIDTNLVSFQIFVRQISEKGYTLCSASEYFKSKNRTKLIICTFDDAYEGVYKYAFPVLKTFNFTATVFACTDYFGKYNEWNFKDTVKRKHLTIQELKELQNKGWEIGSHGKSHKSLLRLSDNELVDEVCDSKVILESYFDRIESFGYPYGDFNDYIKKVVSENYSFAFSLSKGGTLHKIDNHQIRRYFISEFIKVFEI